MGRRALPRIAVAAAILVCLVTSAPQRGWTAPAHLFQTEQCDDCHLLSTQEGTFLRPDAFRRDIVSLCLACHEQEHGAVGHRVGMVPTMPVPEDMPLDAAGRLTCASCHDPHAVEGPNRWMLRRPRGATLCGACHRDGIPEQEPPAAVFVFPPEGSVVASQETVVAGKLANAALPEVRVSTGHETVRAPVVRGTFLAKVRLAPGPATIVVEAGGREARLRLTVRPAVATWKPHLTGDAGQCSLCHPGWEASGFLVKAAPGETCQRCHERVDTLPRRHQPAALGECTACHDPHGAALAGGRARAEERCAACHDPAGAARHLLAVNAGRKPIATACGACHDPHQSTRRALIAAGPGSLALPVGLEAPAPTLRAREDGTADVSLEGFALSADAGRPQLPERFVTLAVPPGADPGSARLRVLEADSAELPGTHAVAAAPPAATWAEGSALTEWGPGKRIRGGRDVAVFETSAPWPPAALTLERAGRLGDLSLVRVAFRPLQYSPGRGTLMHTRRVVAEIEFDPAPPAKGSRAGRRRGAATTVEDLHLLNAGRARAWIDSSEAAAWAAQAGAADATPEASAATAAAPATGLAAAPATPPSETAEYLIVTTRATLAGSGALAEFAAHKAARGLRVRVVTEDDFGAAGAGRQRAEAIREWLKANAPALGARYLLLVGNPHPETGDVPMLRAWPRRDATTNTAYLDAPTDAFYADLSGNWDLDGDGYPGEFPGDAGDGGVDFVAELFVGRIPVYGGDVAPLDAILRKVVAYENEPGDLAWRRSVLLPMSFSDTATDGAWLAEQMKNEYLLGRGFLPWSLYQEGSGGGAASVFSPDAELRGGAVAGRWGSVPYGVVAWWGHGSASRTMVGYAGAWDGDLLAAPTATLNDATPAFVYQTACLNAFPESESNLSFALLKNGAVATVGASRVSWYGVGQRDFRLSATNAGLGYRYVSRLTGGDAAGRALALVKGDPAVAVSADAAWMNLMDFNLYGDPSVSLFPGPVLQASPAALALTAVEGEEEPVQAAVALSSGETTVGVRAQAEAPWLAGSPLATATPGSLTLSALPGGLPAGVHRSQVLLSSAEAGIATVVVPVTLTIARPGSIGGTVTDPAGNPFAGATVVLGGARSRQASTDAAGRYLFTTLPPGGYTVEVSGTGLGLDRPAASLPLAEGEQRTLDFHAVSHEIRGRVTDTARKPIRRAAVRLYDASGVLLRRTVTNARGAYQFRQLGPGDYRVSVRLRPWSFRPGARSVQIADAPISVIGFRGRR